jgi:PIN domain nuclease of toxin-antitoxin system
MGGIGMIVLDTHIIVWDALKPEMLSDKAKEAIFTANHEDGIIFCDISLWEIAMLIKRGKLHVERPYQEFISFVLDANNYLLWSITPEIAERSTQFSPAVTKDPADRIIAATAIIEHVKLVTADQNLRQASEIPTIW